ncbi:hypothetical protein ACO0QE_003172 [Hanseniaspora vineae]
MLQSNVYVGVKPPLNQLVQHDHGLKLIDEKTFDYMLLPVTNTKYRNTVKKYYMEFQDPIHMLKVPPPQLQEISISPKTQELSGGSLQNNSTNSLELPGTARLRTGQLMHIGLVSSWIELESNDVAIRELSYQVLKHEWDYAKFVGIKKLILAPPRNLQNLNEYASMISRLLNSDVIGDENIFRSNPVLSISLPIFEDTNPLSTWELWNTIRNLVDYHPNFTISLALPKYKTPSYVVERWISEPVSCLLLSSSIFSPNRFSYPVLNRHNQDIIYQFQKTNGNQQFCDNQLVIILHGLEKYSKFFIKAGGEQAYLDYTNFLLGKGDKRLTKKYEHLISSENDVHVKAFLSSSILPPLKPNSETLPNAVYHMFEKDSAKYEQYGTAIFAALQDLRSILRPSETLKIMIAGAGRGPLVSRVFTSLKTLGLQKHQYKIIAVEKNPQAVLYLQNKNYQDWNQEVQIVKDDIRNLAIPLEDRDEEKFDLIVSELLGSFGCNELCPEILQYLDLYFSKPSTIFIPWKYSSYLAPVSSSLLHQTLASKDSKKLFEQPWVIHNIPYTVLSSKVNEIWSFTHNADLYSNDETQVGEDGYSLTFLSRSITTKFKMKQKCEIHGLLGVFTANLYKNSVVLSILPKKPIKFLSAKTVDSKKYQHTRSLHSWSPMIFPFKQPLYVTDDTELEVFFTRNNDGQRTWYEWSAQSFMYLITDEVPLALNDTSANDENHHANVENFADDKHAESNGNTRTSAADLNASSIPANSTSLRNSNGAKYADTELNQNENFVSANETGWESVQDIHNLLINGDSSKRNSYLNTEVSKILSKPLFDLKIDEPVVSTSPAPTKNISGALKVSNPQDSPLPPLDTEDTKDSENKPVEYHIRVRANGVTQHNVNGRFFSIPSS